MKGSLTALESSRSCVQAEDVAWVTADSHTLDTRASPESGAEEEPAWQTAECATLDSRSSADPRNEDQLLPEDEELMSDELKDPAWNSASDHEGEDGSSSDWDARTPRPSGT